MLKSITILGIDPGLADTGFGIIVMEGNRLQLIDYGCIHTEAKKYFPHRLSHIAKQLNKILSRHRPSVVAIEGLFFCKNISSAIKVGQAQGVVVATCTAYGIPVEEYTPLQVKLAITGYGKAHKIQIQHMVKVLLKMKSPPYSSHSADALAIAICCAHHYSHKYVKL